jgi:hypothetical protein
VQPCAGRTGDVEICHAVAQFEQASPNRMRRSTLGVMVLCACHNRRDAYRDTGARDLGDR